MIITVKCDSLLLTLGEGLAQLTGVGFSCLLCKIVQTVRIPVHLVSHLPTAASCLCILSSGVYIIHKEVYHSVSVLGREEGREGGWRED